jgi:diaminopropionate ammonia-lyase
MYLKNTLSQHRHALLPQDARYLGSNAIDEVARFHAVRDKNEPTPLHNLPALARRLGLGSLHVKDEGYRLGLSSFKALGGAFALMKLVQDEATRQLDRPVMVSELMAADVREIAATMTFACATDGNHGRSVAQGAQLVGAKSVIFVHAGVSDARIAAIARFGAQIVRVSGNYDDSVAEAARVAMDEGWTVLSDTSWPGYEHIPSLVMQGYTLMVREMHDVLDRPPTHVFLQAGVGGFAAAVAGSMCLQLGKDRPHITVVEPSRAACLFESAQAGRLHKIAESQPTVMAMLECYEPSMIAYRILERAADGFMTVEDDDAKAVMRRLAQPSNGDPAIVAGESGGAGLAGLLAVMKDQILAHEIGLGPSSRVLVINTEEATDPELYLRIVGKTATEVLKGSTA